MNVYLITRTIITKEQLTVEAVETTEAIDISKDLEGDKIEGYRDIIEIRAVKIEEL